MSLVRLEAITKAYHEQEVLHPTHLVIEAGEFVSVMGPSGSGKSTLLHLLGCLDKPTSGTYWFEQQAVQTLTQDELADLRLKKIGFVFQNFQLLDELTALENVAMPLTYAHHPEAQKVAHQALTQVGLAERCDYRPHQLSGGQKQRVAIARALINQPSLLLADEPTGALDQQTGHQILDLFKQLHQQGLTIFMITHDPHVASVASRRLHLVDGRLT